MKRILIALAAAACSRQQQPPPVTQSSSLAITAVDAMPGQVNAGDAVTLAWSTTGAERATLAEGAGQPTDVLVSDSLVVRPAATTVYTLVVYNKAGLTPASLTARMVARVRGPTSVSGFIATPPEILQGESSTLSWSGNATRYSIKMSMRELLRDEEHEFGEIYAHGISKNTTVIDLFLDYCHEQGVTSRRLALDQVFAASTLDS